jgi:Tfp pilus assembly protein PilE
MLKSIRQTFVHNQPLRSEAGVTIVELIVTLVVGSILVGSTVLITTSYSRISARTLYLTVANSYAENKVESLRSLGFLGLADGTTDITNELPTELKNPRSASVQISSPSATTKKVDLTITYNDQGAPRTYTYTTYIGELGVGQY